MSKKILIVEDEPHSLETLKDRLEFAGYQVITASDGVGGLKKAQEEKPDLILLDLMLPKMDGYEVCQLLKFDEKYKHIPVIMLTAKTQEADKITGKQTGANEYVTKPFEAEELIAKVKEYLKE